MTRACPSSLTAQPGSSASTEPEGRAGGAESVATLSAAELGSLRSSRLLSRLATSDAHGQPHVVPVGWHYHEQLGTFDISGRNFAATRKYRNVQANPKAALVIDDVLPPWRPRCVHVQGSAESVPGDPSTGTEALIRLTPSQITSWGLDGD